MFKNFITTAWRNLVKHKTLSLINLFGLAVGMACSLLIFLFVADELSYDRLNKDADRIYRVVKDFVNSDGTHLPDATTPPAAAPAIQKEIPGIEHVTRVYPNWGENFLISYKDKHIYTEKLFRVDSSFFDVFTFPFIQGDAKNAFKEINSVILTQSAAEKYFGAEDPMGKVLKIDQLGSMMVSGVVNDVPDNAHFHFDVLIPLRKMAGNIDENWGRYNFYTYIKLKPHVSISGIEPQIQALYQRNRPNENNVYYTQGLTGIHLDSKLKWEMESNSERLYILVFAILGLLIITIATINYINLVTARSSLRSREIGIRKVTGAYKASLIKQFLGESIFLCMMSAGLALVISQMLLPFVNGITTKQLEIFSSGNYVVVYFIASAMITGVLAGLFPALYLSSFKPILVLKGTKVRETNLLLLRKALVVIQFSISIALIAGSLIIYRQIKYMQSASLGLNKDQVLIIDNYDNLAGNQNAFLQEILQIQGVQDVAGANGIVGGLNGTNRFKLKGSEQGALVNLLITGYDFLQVLGIRIKEGRSFSANFQADTLTNISSRTLDQTVGSIILNEQAVKELQLPFPSVGQLLQMNKRGDTTYYLKIIGVTENFHFASFKNEIKPFAFIVNPRRTDNLTVKLTGQNLSASLQLIETKWKQFAPDRPFQYTFLDETFAQLYKSETNFQKIFFSLVILSIVIACLGLFGLAAFTAEQRTKEIGIRKVMGASVIGITAMLSKDFLKLVMVSILIATPLAWWTMNAWLQNYVYRISINGWIFLAAALLSIFIALFTISFQTIKAAVANPIRSLRTE